MRYPVKDVWSLLLVHRLEPPRVPVYGLCDWVMDCVIRICHETSQLFVFAHFEKVQVQIVRSDGSTVAQIAMLQLIQTLL